MFLYVQSFNQDIGTNVKYMYRMFCLAKAFNQPIGNWDISNVENK